MDYSKYYVFYDGDCGFCNYWVQWILKNDKKDQFLFTALQSDFGQIFLKERGLESKDFNTLYLWKPMEFYLVTQAVSKIEKILGGRYAFLSYLNIFPKLVSDKIYDEIAKHRLKLAAQNCLLPDTRRTEKIY